MVITYVAVKLLKTSFYKNFHVTTTLPPSIIDGGNDWSKLINTCKYGLQSNLLQITICRPNTNRPTKCAIFFCASVLDQVLG